MISRWSGSFSRPLKASASATANGSPRCSASTSASAFTAIDDFGAGFAGLNLLADFQPDIIKLDMDLIRGIDQSRPRQAIVRGTVAMCEELGIQVIGEGVETADECSALHDLGIHLMQGYLFSRPLFESCGQAERLAWPR